MDFIKDALLEKRSWRFVNEILKFGSQWMLKKFGEFECDTIARASIASIVLWIVLAILTLILKLIAGTSFSSGSLGIALAIYVVVLVCISSILIMSAVAAGTAQKSSL